jgi:hypothetical protein
MDAGLRFPSDCSMAPSRPGARSATTHSKSVGASGKNSACLGHGVELDSHADCGCVEEQATMVRDPFGKDKIVMRMSTPALAGTRLSNDIIYAVMSGTSKYSP